MSVETRSTSALFKRAEQLKRWEDSDTNRESAIPKQKSRKIKFSSGCIFLAACAAGDKDEVVKLLERGADINTANVDGLTALHQACIDDNLDMVEFLVEHGADVNRGDNEGWTPLHATASCGFLYIAKYLIDKGANISAVNNDGELAIDIAECQKMEDLLKEEIESRGVDCNEARNEEEKVMLRDATDWLLTKSSLVNLPHPKNGATPLHIASAKGYLEVMKILLKSGADIDAQDVDGWTPLHAAAHWNQKEACQLLVENLADLDATNFVGQTPHDLSDSNILTYLDELRKRQNKEELVVRRQSKKRQEIHEKCLDTETPSKVKKVEIDVTSENEKTTEPSDSSNMIEVPMKEIKNSQVEEIERKEPEEINKSNTPVNTTSMTNILQPLRRLFVPPVRDEESETQRKAHAKRVRETRRSTQGVTLEEIRSAEQLIRKQNNDSSETAVTPNSINGVNVTIKTGSPTIITRESEELPVAERRPSWRLKIDNGTCKFKLEDATKPPVSPTPSFIRKGNTGTTIIQRPSSELIETADTTVTVSLRRPKSLDDKEQDKENDVRNAQATVATQAAIQRRRRPKRRSTGVVSFDNVEDLLKENETPHGGDCEDSLKLSHQESGTDRSSRSRINSISDIRNENGEIDYKKLYEQQLAENEKIKDKLRKSEEELRETKQTLEKINVVTSKNSLSELEKRERRAMERKLSEMEEELKNLDNLKTENQRLKEENGALIRVISKLSK